MPDHRKLYVLTRQDLSPGQQATQSAHAAFSLAHEHPELTRDWYERSSYLVLLGVPDEPALRAWIERLADVGATMISWREPDLDDELTSLAVAPSPGVERALSSLPLLLREPAMT